MLFSALSRSFCRHCFRFCSLDVNRSLRQDKERYAREFEDLTQRHSELEEKEINAQRELKQYAHDIAGLNKRISELSSHLSEKTQKQSENEKLLKQVRRFELQYFIWKVY